VAAGSPPMKQCVVDNRVLLLGLDALYREAMKQHEREELLPCARTVAAVLRTRPADGPVAGYYGEDDSLTEYFQLLRALQEIDGGRIPEVAHLPAFQRLKEILEAPLFGRGVHEGKLLPVGRDPLTQALIDTRPRWSVPGLTAQASVAARATGDFSLVGLAARAQEAVVLTALRESVVLYAERAVFSKQPAREFIWAVDQELASAAQQFIDAFNTLLSEQLPAATPAQAEHYWEAHDKRAIVGRCACLGDDLTGRHYHWAICRSPGGQAVVQDFWSHDVWTTTAFRAALGVEGRCPDLPLSKPQAQYGDIIP